jgi:hypothetical protein
VIFLIQKARRLVFGLREFSFFSNRTCSLGEILKSYDLWFVIMWLWVLYFVQSSFDCSLSVINMADEIHKLS